MSAPTLNQEQYVAAGGANCPGCDSGDGVEGGSVEIDAGGASQNCYCVECGAEWTDLYDLKSYDNFQPGA